MTISRDGKIPPSIEVKCPNCGLQSAIPLQFSDGNTIDYEGTCKVFIESPDTLCNTSLLITVTLPEEPEDNPQQQNLGAQSDTTE